MYNRARAAIHLPLGQGFARHPGKEHTVSDKRERSGSEKRQKTLLRAVRFSPDEDEIIRKKAEDARLTVSAYIRSAALNKRVHS